MHAAYCGGIARKLEMNEDSGQEAIRRIRAVCGADGCMFGNLHLMEMIYRIDRVLCEEKGVDYESEAIHSIVDFIGSLNEDELILVICSEGRVDEIPTNRKTVDDVLSRRIEVAEGMVIGDKVSVSMGADLADVDIGEFMALFRERNG